MTAQWLLNDIWNAGYEAARRGQTSDCYAQGYRDEAALEYLDGYAAGERANRRAMLPRKDWHKVWKA